MTAAAYVRAAVAKGDGFEMYRALFDCPLFRPTRSGGALRIPNHVRDVPAALATPRQEVSDAFLMH